MTQESVVPFPKIPPKRAWTAAQNALHLDGWIGRSRPVDVDIRYGLSALRARSREAAQNSDQMRAYLREVRTNVLGHKGIVLQAGAMLRNGRPDKRARAAIERGWKIWGKKGSCDVTGQHSWRSLCNLMVDTAARDGEAFLRAIPGWPGNTAGFALQLIDPEAVDIEYNVADLPGGVSIRMGVELDEWRRPMAYWVNPEPRSIYSLSSRHTSERTRIPADEIIHAYLPEWVWQTRGVPWASTPLQRMKILEGYEEAAVEAARAAASKMAFYKRGEDAGELTGETDDGGNLIKEATPGGMEELPIGYDVTTVDWGWPNADHAQFERPILKNIAAGLGVNYISWANDADGVNFSSARFSAIRERDVWRALQQWFVEDVSEQVYARWIESAMMRNALTANGTPLSLDRLDEFSEVNWRPRGWQSVDIEKEVKAHKTMIENRETSISAIIRERGDEPDEVWTELAADKARLEALGISMTEGASSEDAPEDSQGGDDSASRFMEILLRAASGSASVDPSGPQERQDSVINITNQVATPSVEVTNQVEPTPVDVRVDNIVETPEVTVEQPDISVQPPEVRVENSFQAPDVNVTVEQPTSDRRISFERDRQGEITGASIEDD